MSVHDHDYSTGGGSGAFPKNNLKYILGLCGCFGLSLVSLLTDLDLICCNTRKIYECSVAN